MKLKGGEKMNNNIFQNLSILKAQSYYGGVSSSFKIRGTLVEKHENTIKINIGKDKIIEAQLKEPIEGEVGETVIIDKKDILESRLCNEDTVEETISIEEGRETLQKLNLPVNEETKEALQALENYGVDITKENIQDFIVSKTNLEKVIQGLDYDTAIKLMDKNINLEEESLEKIVEILEEVKEEKEGFSLFKLLGLKKDMTTGEAEKISERIYGSKMGKDITDIIKALDKAGADITKKNIDTVDRIFSKVDNLQDIEDDTVIDAIKNKIDTTIDNLYKLKNAVVKNIIAVEEKVSQWATNAYEATSFSNYTITEKDLKLMEEDIKDLLTSLDIKVTEESMSLAKDLVKAGLEISKENIEKVTNIKEALKELQGSLDYEKLATLIKSGIEIEKEEITSLAKLLKEGLETANIEDTNLEGEKIEGILNTIEKLQKIEDHQLLELIKKGVDFKLGKLQFLTSNGNQEKFLLQTKGLDEGIQTLVHQHVRTITTLNKLENLDFNSIAYHMNSKLPTTLEGLVLSQSQAPVKVLEVSQETIIKNHIISRGITLGLEGNQQDVEGAKALISNNIPFNRENIMRLYEINNHIENIRDRLSSHMLRELTYSGRVVENMEIEELSNYVMKEVQEGVNTEKHQSLKGLIKNLEGAYPQREGILSLFMKNAIPLNLKEVEQMSFFLNNQQQITSDLNDILGTLKKSKNEEIKDLGLKIEEFLKESTENLKSGNLRGERFYQQLGRWMREVDSKSHFMEATVKQDFEKNSEDLRESLNLQSQLNKEDAVLQFPIMMENQLKNLQMYILNNKKSSKKIDPDNMSVLLNFDTNNMGNINIYTAVNYKKVVMKVGVKNLQDKNLFENNIKKIEGLLKELGYELKEMSFRIEEGQDLLTMAEEDIQIHQPIKRFLDITI
jgi:hypothetical protein